MRTVKTLLQCSSRITTILKSVGQRWLAYRQELSTELGAIQAALRSEADGLSGQPHVYEVEPTAEFEDDPNVTDKKFPGNPTRSYRSAEPLRVIREVSAWKRLSPADLQLWRQRLAAIAEDDSKEIINLALGARRTLLRSPSTPTCPVVWPSRG
ncbi:NAD(+)--rifampin ADP-ribosyltransferase [Brevibacterium sp.]|uniref:NAD(+)--rifampin ADP-ribosyltransferase n=1 Tax=Brevibacterium sp. TaxID=1701 RepID=UPI002636B8DE|nr:NAD(+)--rifampin ADP-ribosyltransferase [Brevibacterium sp.]